MELFALQMFLYLYQITELVLMLKYGSCKSLEYLQSCNIKLKQN